MAMLRPHDRGWSPWAVQSPRPRPGLHLALVPKKACCREVPVTSSRHVAPPLSLHTTIMNILRKLTGTTTTPDAGDKRIREEPPRNKLTKKPHQPKLKTDLGTILPALPVSTFLGKGKFPALKTLSTTVAHSQPIPKPIPRLVREDSMVDMPCGKPNLPCKPRCAILHYPTSLF